MFDRAVGITSGQWRIVPPKGWGGRGGESFLLFFTDCIAFFALHCFFFFFSEKYDENWWDLYFVAAISFDSPSFVFEGVSKLKLFHRSTTTEEEE